MKRLEIGSGNRPLDGYEHLDINPDCPHVEYVAPMDDIPVEDNTFDEVNSIHVIEHQPWPNTLNTLQEWVRVLKPGGLVYIATPNLRFIAEAYMEAQKGNRTNFMRDYSIMHPLEQEKLCLNGIPNPALWANFKIMSSTGKWDQHFACYDADMLTALLKKAGCSKTEVIHDTDSLVVKGWK